MRDATHEAASTAKSDLPNGGHSRRAFFQLAGATGFVFGAGAPGVAAQPQAPAPAAATPSTSAHHVVTGATENVDQNETTADILVEGLIAWGATHVFGIVGDGINPVIEALRKRKDKIAFIGCRHEEAAAFMASGMAKHSGRLGVCVGTTGPGAIHLINGLYDAALDGAPVVAITGTTFHDLGGMRFMQSVNTVKLMQDVALFNEEVSGPAHAVLIVNRACRAALPEPRSAGL